MRKFICLIIIGACQLSACVNSTYSRLDEKRVTNELAYIVMGQFAHRSTEFYRFQEKKAQASLSEDENNFSARNDLAVAYIKLGRYQDAEKELQKNEDLYPGKYETAANLGVLYKKKEDFAQAAKYIEQSLQIKAGGHMGLGDYYLKMCESLDKEDLTINFLGVAYDAEPQVNADVANKEYLISLIKNDYMFADAYLILGDVFFVEGEYQLAALAYGRAKYLGISYNIYKRLNLLREKWRGLKKAGELVEDRHSLYRSISKSSKEAQIWVDQFKVVDADLIKRTGEAKSIDAVLQEMEKQGIKREFPLTVGVFKGYRVHPGAIFFFLWISVIAIIVFLIIRKRMKKNKKDAEVNEQ